MKKERFKKTNKKIVNYMRTPFSLDRNRIQNNHEWVESFDNYMSPEVCKKRTLNKIFEINAKIPFYLGYENYILGYNIKNNAIIYDSWGIRYQLIKEKIINNQIKKIEEVCLDDYFDEAEQFLLEKGLTSNTLIIDKKNNEIFENIEPILVDYNQYIFSGSYIKNQKNENLSEFEIEINNIANEDNVNPLILKGYDNHFYGFDFYTKGIIYSGDSIIKQLTADRIRVNKKNSRNKKNYKKYYNEAFDFVKNNGIPSTFYFEGKKTDFDYPNKLMPEPIIIFESIL